jgi:drug/metabolite transporter (DMT)-like permease
VSSPSQLSRAPVAQRDRIAGILLMITALACLSCLDASAKWLVRQMPLTEVLFMRYLVAFLLIFAFLNPVRAPRAWATPKLWLQTLRGLALLGSTICMFVASHTMPLADIIAINFSLPIIIVLLSGPLLGERIGFKQWCAIIVGFVGVLIVAQPGSGSMNVGFPWVVAAVGCNVFYQMVTRRLSATASTASMMLISAALPSVLALPFVPAIWVTPPSLHVWIVLLLPGVFGALGHYLLVRAYTRAPAPTIAPFAYTQIAWSTLLGFLIFGDVPPLATIIGAGVVILSGLYLFIVETRARLQPVDEPDLAVAAE